MALGPEVSEDVRRKKEERLQSELEADRKFAFQVLEGVAELMEKEFDRQILSENHQEPYTVGSYTSKKLDKDKLSAFYAVVRHAKVNLIKILEGKYLPKGWKKVSYDGDQKSEGSGSKKFRLE